jgi:hypothetical protein
MRLPACPMSNVHKGYDAQMITVCVTVIILSVRELEGAYVHILLYTVNCYYYTSKYSIFLIDRSKIYAGMVK